MTINQDKKPKKKYYTHINSLAMAIPMALNTQHNKELHDAIARSPVMIVLQLRYKADWATTLRCAFEIHFENWPPLTRQLTQMPSWNPRKNERKKKKKQLKHFESL